MKIALAESTSPSAATKEQSADAVAVVSNASLAGFRVSATETAVATVLGPVVRPIARTTRAVRTTMASGEASLRRSRYDIVETLSGYMVTFTLLRLLNELTHNRVFSL